MASDSLLAERDLTDDERAAVADEPRPGIVTAGAGGHVGDPLTQEQTDAVIAWELLGQSSVYDPPPPDRSELRELLGAASPVAYANGTATEQRGGIHSEPLVRLLAYRAWGDRDRRWFTFGFDEIVTYEDGFTRELVVDCRYQGRSATERISDQARANARDPKLLVQQAIGRLGRKLGVTHPNLPRRD